MNALRSRPVLPAARPCCSWAAPGLLRKRDLPGARPRAVAGAARPTTEHVPGRSATAEDAPCASSSAPLRRLTHSTRCIVSARGRSRAHPVRARIPRLRFGIESGIGSFEELSSGAAAGPRHPRLQQPVRPPTAPEARSLAQGHPLGPKGEPSPRGCCREAAVALLCLPRAAVPPLHVGRLGGENGEIKLDDFVEALNLRPSSHCS